MERLNGTTVTTGNLKFINFDSTDFFSMTCWYCTSVVELTVLLSQTFLLHLLTDCHT